MTSRKIKLVRHVGYSASMSPEANVIKARQGGYSYLTIFHELDALSKLQKGDGHAAAAKVFRAGANIALKRHNEGKR